MYSDIFEKFKTMDGLSQQRVPFLFLVDFQVENIEIYTEDEIAKNGLLVDFPNLAEPVRKEEATRAFSWQAFPESMDLYKQGFDIIRKNLLDGNSYLANYTCQTMISTDLSLEEIFSRSKAKYKFCRPDHFVFFSPETFIKIQGDKISTYPMKGTADASAENAEENLKINLKEKAEHHTVTDLLRNDLSMVSKNVTVEDFGKVELIRTAQKNLYAMSSKISGELRREFRSKVGSILAKLLPAGSILGAPKKKTLEIISQAERYNRGWYTGVCGYFDGKDLDSCVMIRFLENKGGKLYFKSGGGITHISKMEEEYQEMINKIYVPIF